MPFEDHPEIPGAVAMRRADGSLSPPLSPDMAIGYDPISFAAYKQAKAAPPVDAGAGVPFEAGGETVRMLPASGPNAPIPEPVANVAWDAPKDFAEPIKTQQQLADEAEAQRNVDRANAADLARANADAAKTKANVPMVMRPELAGPVASAGAAPIVGKAATAGTFAAEPQGGAVAPRSGAVGLSEFVQDTANERAFNNEMIKAELAKRGGGPVRTVPERDQKTGFQIEGARGPDPKLLQAMFEGQQGTPRPELEAAPTLALTPKDVLEVWQPPKVESGKDKNFAPLFRDMTPKEKEQWAAGVAAKAAKDGLSAETLNRLYEPNLSVAKGRQTGEEIDAYRKARIAAWDSDLAKRSAERDAKNASTIAASRAEEEKMGGPMGLAGYTLKENEQERDTAERNADRVDQAAVIEDQHSNAEQQLFNRQRDALADLDTKIRTVSEKASAEVDPKKFWKDKSAGEKVLMVIASIFGGGGAALAGQPSMYAARLESAIDADIQAQKTNIANAKGSLNQLQGLYQDVSQRYGSEHAGLLSMKVARLGGVESQIKANLATATSAKARIQAEKTLALVEQKIRETKVQLSAEMNGKIATNYKTIAAHQVGGGGGPNVKAIQALLEKNRQISGGLAKDSAGIAKDGAAALKDNPGPNAHVFMLGTDRAVFADGLGDSEKAMARKTGMFLNDAEDRLQQLEASVSRHGAQWLHSKDGEALVRKFLVADSSADNQGVVKTDDVDSGMRTFRGYQAEEAMASMRRSLGNTKKNVARSYAQGIQLPDGSVRPLK